jgi:transcriptional regulator with XRE-family HTH domain
MTPTQLANEVGVTVSYIGRILAGSRKLKRNPVLRRSIAKALDVPVHWIEAERPDPERVTS